MMTENQIAKVVLDASIKVHRALGPGLLEKTYESCLAYEISKRGLKVERQKELPVVYDDQLMEEVGYRVDLLVEGKFIVELKSVEAINNVHVAQIITYLKLSECRLGFLINFNVALLVKGLTRYANNLPE